MDKLNFYCIKCIMASGSWYNVIKTSVKFLSHQLIQEFDYYNHHTFLGGCICFSCLMFDCAHVKYYTVTTVIGVYRGSGGIHASPNISYPLRGYVNVNNVIIPYLLLY